MINVSPIGRNCSQEERDDFEKYDKVGLYSATSRTDSYCTSICPNWVEAPIEALEGV